MHPRFSPTLQRATLCAFALAAALLTPIAHAALQDRDLDGDTVVDAFYDTELNITWLRDANVNGAQDWDTQVAWAANFSFGVYDDWRLPTSDACEGFNCTGSEMGHLYYVELGNVTDEPLTNPGSFLNLQVAAYWSGTAFAPSPSSHAYSFFLTDGDSGSQLVNNQPGALHAFAVRDGDVTAVPEPATNAMLMLGLGALALATRRRPR